MFKKILLVASIATCFVSSHAANTVHYRQWADYHGTQLPDFDTLGTPTAKGTLKDFTTNGIKGGNIDHYAAILEGKLKVAKAETYTIYFASDDGARLYVDGDLLIDNDGKHGTRTKTATIDLAKGRHALKVEYFDYDKGKVIGLLYSTPTIQLRGYADLPKGTPGFVMKQARETAARFTAWKGNDETVVFPILTDVHTARRSTWRHFGWLAETAPLFGYDFMLNLGDIGLNNEVSKDNKAYSDFIIDRTREQMALYDGIWLYGPGNHDFDNGENVHISSEQLSEWFQKPWKERAGDSLHLTEGQTWCWYEVPGKDTRVVILNSQSSETLGKYYYVYGKEQLEWLEKVLCETPEGCNVIVISHYQPHPIGRWISVKDANRPQCEVLMKLLADYNGKRAGSFFDSEWDFSSAHGNLVGLFSGDSHINALVETDGVHYFTSQGLGEVGKAEMLPGQKREWFNADETLCCDVVAFKPATGELHTFRIGAGGAEYDESYHL